MSLGANQSSEERRTLAGFLLVQTFGLHRESAADSKNYRKKWCEGEVMFLILPTEYR